MRRMAKTCLVMRIMRMLFSSLVFRGFYLAQRAVGEIIALGAIELTRSSLICVYRSNHRLYYENREQRLRSHSCELKVASTLHQIYILKIRVFTILKRLQICSRECTFS
jgi:hypothetical protein